MKKPTSRPPPPPTSRPPPPPSIRPPLPPPTRLPGSQPLRNPLPPSNTQSSSELPPKVANGNFESRFIQFFNLSLPPVEPFTNCEKSYPSQNRAQGQRPTAETTRPKAPSTTPLPPRPPPPTSAPSSVPAPAPPPPPPPPPPPFKR